MDAEQIQECRRMVDGQTASFPCTLAVGHAGPCYSVDVYKSVARRKLWETENLPTGETAIRQQAVIIDAPVGGDRGINATLEQVARSYEAVATSDSRFVMNARGDLERVLTDEEQELGRNARARLAEFQGPARTSQDGLLMQPDDALLQGLAPDARNAVPNLEPLPVVASMGVAPDVAELVSTMQNVMSRLMGIQTDLMAVMEVLLNPQFQGSIFGGTGEELGD